MADNVLKSIYQNNPKLFSLIHEFNVRPGSYLHKSWLQKVFQETTAEILHNSKRGRLKISEHILSELNNEFLYDFQSEIRRLALVDGISLARLMYYVGVAANSDRIAKVIDGKQATALKRHIGVELYEFALKRAPLLKGNLDLSFLRSKSNQKNFRSYLILCGKKCMEICLTGEPVSLTRRLEIKFPITLHWNFVRPVTVDMKSTAWQLIRKILLQETGPQWKVLFS